MIDNTAVDGKAGVGDQDLNIGRKTVLCAGSVNIRLEIRASWYDETKLTRTMAYGLAPLQIPLLEEFVDCTLYAAWSGQPGT